MKRETTKEKELRVLAKEYKKNPLLFKAETYIDTPEALEDFGIFIRGKDKLSSGYLKLWPQDFIVEEVTKTGEKQDITVEDFFDKQRDSSEKDQTVYTTLVKCGLSTIEAVGEIISLSNIDRKQIAFSGIKDKDALTSQLISIRKAKIEEIKNINSSFLFFKNSFSGKGAMEVGGLKGNEFTVLIRTDKNFTKEIFTENLNKIKKEGFSNFFYLQRFGTPRLINFYWGLFILKGEYEKAVSSFLSSPGKRELPYFKELRNKLKENFGNWAKIDEILDPFPLIFQNERRVVGHLKNNPEDFAGALNQIPEQIQLWLFALASLLFNKSLSEYLKKDGKAPKTLPLILSNDKKDWLPYQKILSENGIKSLPFDNLKPFPYIQWKRREIKTNEKVDILDYKIIPEGVILDFILPKACYATTFLAHLFNLVSGLPPGDISTYPIDTKASLGKESLEETLNRFTEVIYPKTEDFIKKLSLEIN